MFAFEFENFFSSGVNMPISNKKEHVRLTTRNIKKNCNMKTSRMLHLHAKFER